MDRENQTVDVFVSAGRFRTWAEIREYIDETYTDDGDGVPSEFMEEVELTDYEPMAIESFVSETGREVLVSDLLQGASYSEQWLAKIGSAAADAAICVFSPNRLLHPERSKLNYLGRFQFKV